MVVSPVTGIFTHESTDVWTLHFDNGDSLGVTGSHPIYSLDADGWVLASTLATGNQVLTKSGHAIVTSVNKQSGLQTVYNLEVRALHNFLVGESGVVVHNACSKVFLKELMDDPDFDDILAKLPSGQVKDNLITLKTWKQATPPDPKYQKFLDDFDVDVPVEGVKAWKALFPDELIRTNTTWLQKLDDYLTVSPNKLDEVTDMFAIEKGKNRVTAYLRGLLERKHYNGTVYRGDLNSVTPEVAFNNGIAPKGSHDNLIKHLDGGSTGGVTNKGNYVSSSKDISIANDFASNNGYVFKVRTKNNKGIDVNETLGDEIDNWFEEQIEVSLIGGIDKKDIIGAYPKGSLTQNDFIPNPNYEP